MNDSMFDSALKDLALNFKEALRLNKEKGNIKSPVSWALYQTWRKYDAIDMEDKKHV